MPNESIGFEVNVGPSLERYNRQRCMAAIQLSIVHRSCLVAVFPFNNFLAQRP